MKVFSTAYALEVFANDADTITLKQEDPLDGDTSVIVIPPDRVEAVVKALRAAKKEAEEG